MKIKKINVHLTEEQIEQRVRELGAEISKVYGDEPVPCSRLQEMSRYV